MPNERLLGQRNAVDGLRAGHVNTAQENDEGGAAANENGVDEHRKRLGDSLCDRVTDVCRRSHVGRGTKARLVGKQTAAQALCNRRTHAAAHRLLETEGIGNDARNNAGNGADIHHDNDKRHEEIADGHDRDDDVGGFRNAVNTAENDETRDDGQQGAGPDPFDAQAVVRGSGHGIALKGVEAQTKGCDQAHCVEDGEPSVVRA